MAKEKYVWVMCRVPEEAKASLDKVHKALHKSDQHLSPQKAELWIAALAWLEEQGLDGDIFLKEECKVNEHI